MPLFLTARYLFSGVSLKGGESPRGRPDRVKRNSAAGTAGAGVAAGTDRRDVEWPEVVGQRCELEEVKRVVNCAEDRLLSFSRSSFG